MADQDSFKYAGWQASSVVHLLCCGSFAHHHLNAVFVEITPTKPVLPRLAPKLSMRGTNRPLARISDPKACPAHVFTWEKYDRLSLAIEQHLQGTRIKGWNCDRDHRTMFVNLSFE